MFGARDIFGIKPFYYAQMNGSFLFGSEIKSFVEHPKFDKVFNEEALGNYLSFQFVPTNETFLKGYIVSSRDIILLTRMESLRLQDTLNRILQEIRTSHLMRLWMKSRK